MANDDVLESRDPERISLRDRMANWLGRLYWRGDRWHIPQAILLPIKVLELRLLMHQMRDWNLEFDARENGQLRLPKGESIALPIFWMAEMITPSLYPGFLAAIRERGWISKESEYRLGLQDWISDVRQAPGSQGMHDLVTLVGTKPKHWSPGDSLITRLPNEFEKISIQVVSVSSATLVLIVAFELRRDLTRFLDQVLERDAEPTYRRVGLTISGESVDGAKERMISESIIRLHETGQKWIAKMCPGFFAGESMAAMPVLDLILSTIADPGEPETMEHRRFLGLLGLGNEFDAWKSIQVRGLSLHDRKNRRFWTKDSRRFRNYYVMSGREDRVFEDATFDDRGASRSIHGIKHLMSDHVPGILSRIATGSFLEVRLANLISARDNAKLLHDRRGLKGTLQLRDYLLRVSLDLNGIASDVEKLAEDEKRFAWQVSQFEAQGKYRELMEKEQIHRLTTYMARQQKSQARELQQADKQLRETLEVVASMNAVVADYRLQRIVLTFSAISLVASGLAVMFAVNSWQEWFLKLFS